MAENIIEKVKINSTEYDIVDANAVKITAQTLTEEQKAQARENVGAAEAFDPSVYGLPILSLTGDTSAMTKENPVSLSYNFEGRIGVCDVKWQGASSLDYPKKNYTIKFDNAFEAADGWGEQKKYCAKANYIDHSHARNVVSAKLWGKIVKSRTETENETESVNLLDGVYLSNGYMLNANTGAASANTVWSAYMHTLIPAANTLYISYTSTSLYKQYVLCFYDENKTFINAVSFSGNSNNYHFGHTLLVPSNAAYFRFSYSTFISASNGGGTAEISDVRVQTITPANANLLDAISVSSGYKLNDNDGNVHVDENCNTYIHAPIPTIDKLYVSYTSTSAYKHYQITFYDINKIYISTVSSEFDSGTYDFVHEVAVPSNAAHFRFSYSTFIPQAYGGGTAEISNLSVRTPSLLSRLKTLPNGGAVDGFPIVITLNGNFHGLYTFNIPKDAWMFDMNSPTIPQAIICADKHVAATQFKAEAVLDGSDFELEYASNEENAEWVTTSLNALINAVMSCDGSVETLNNVSRYLDWQSAIDYYIFTALNGGHDLTDKNYILATYDGIKWFFSAYDMDSTWGLHSNGQSFYTADDNAATITSFSTRHALMNLIKTYKTNELKARYEELRASILSEINVTQDFITFTAGIPSTIFAEDVKKWSTVPSTSTSNVWQILNWYRLRVDIINAQIDAL